MATDVLAETSESEQMYLVHTAMALEAGATSPLPVAVLTKALGVSTAAANEMIHKLAERGLLEYSPYKGVTLTAAGNTVAGAVLRRRRLWTVFLVDRLGFDAAAADAVACDLEHVTPRLVTDRLAAFLGDPGQGPQGRPIPPAGEGAVGEDAAMSLQSGVVGGRYVVRGYVDDTAATEYLASQGLAIGAELTVAAIGSPGAWLIITPQSEVQLSPELVRAIRVSPITDGGR